MYIHCNGISSYHIDSYRLTNYKQGQCRRLYSLFDMRDANSLNQYIMAASNEEHQLHGHAGC